MKFKEFLPPLIKQLEQIVPYACALYKESAGVRVTVNKVQESIEPENPAKGLVFTLWNGQHFYEYARNDWADETDLSKGVTEFAKQAMKTRNPSLPSSDWDPGEPMERDFQGPSSDFHQTVSHQDLLDEARDNLKAGLSADPAVVNAVCRLGVSGHNDIFVNRRKIMSQEIVRSDFVFLIFVTDGNQTRELFHGKSKNGDLSRARIDRAHFKKMAEDGKRLLNAKRLPPGVYDTVCDPEWSGIIAHECFGHGMETDLYTRDRALSRRYIGKQIASPLVNMFDDPSLLDEAGGYFFDDEGRLSDRTSVIQDGVLQRGLTDATSAMKLNLKRSANGRRESFARKAYARMSNTFFENGTSGKEDILSTVKDGFYLRYATNGMEDPQAWGIQVEGLWAEEIKNGKPTGNVFSPVIMTGFVPDLLQSISMVGNDRFISGLGMCGKGHKEWVKNTTGGPHLKMKARLA